MQKTRIATPTAAVIIYNFRDRFGSYTLDASKAAKFSDEDDKYEQIDSIILNTYSLRSVKTRRSKGSPNGTFEIRLAPYKNWVTAITPGSWCIILMSQNPITTDDLKTKVSKEKFKMLGRIESVRAITAVDSKTGAMSTEYEILGADWGSIFNTHLYLDAGLRTEEDTKKVDGSPGGSAQMTFQSLINGLCSEKSDAKYTSRGLINVLMGVWGKESDSDLNKTLSSFEAVSPTLIRAVQTFKIPKELKRYMGFSDTNLANAVNVLGGKLTGYDRYDNFATSKDGFGIIEQSSILGVNQFWQLLIDCSNPVLNELIPEIRWDEKGDKANLTLYHRIRPFCVNTNKDIKKDNRIVGDGLGSRDDDTLIDSWTSRFTNIKRHYINIEDILQCEAGTNWRDRFNFIRIRPVRFGGNAVGLTNQFEQDSQFYDKFSIGRDGFKPMSADIKFYPVNNYMVKSTPLFGIVAYKYILKEWYFDIHSMLNGTVIIIGRNDYIGVGDNILFHAKAINSQLNINKASLTNSDPHVLAHVESIAHTMSIADNGAKSFITEIQFVRGIITNSKGEFFGAVRSELLDQDASTVSESDEIIKKNRGVSIKGDPDPLR